MYYPHLLHNMCNIGHLDSLGWNVLRLFAIPAKIAKGVLQCFYPRFNLSSLSHHITQLVPLLEIFKVVTLKMEVGIL